MTPKQKANHLVDKFYNANENLTYELCKIFALFLVDEILKVDFYFQSDTTYWIEVKKEINKL